MASPKISCLLSAFSLLLLIFLPVVAQAGDIFIAKRMINGDNIKALKEHDENRHSRMLAGKPMDVYMGGGLTTAGYWYTEVAIGTPPQNFTVMIDTGSNLLWVYCEGCKNCPIKSESLGIKLTPYNPNISESARTVAHEENICNEMVDPQFRINSSKGPLCDFNMSYADSYMSIGYLVKDLVNFNQVSDQQQNQPAKANIVLGCATEVHTSDFMNDHLTKFGREGIIGFGPGNASMISQLAKSGKVRNEFAHCLDKEGGIFAIGHVVHPKVNMVKIYKADHYNIKLESAEVDGQSIQRVVAAIIDSGCNMAYFPKEIYNFLMEKVLSKHSNLSFYKDEVGSTCFHYSGSLDKDFPVISFHFGNSTLNIHPHDYFIQDQGKLKPSQDSFCIGFRESQPNFATVAFIGDLFLRNKVVVYDRANMLLGWKDYNCSASIAVEDETNGGVCTINAHNFTAELSH